jgi:HEAT repeat protein
MACRTGGRRARARHDVERRGAQGSADPTFRKWADESVRTLKDNRSADARAKAAEYLGGFEYPEAVEALQAALRDPDAKVRAAAASALWKAGEPARAARPALVAALDDPAPAVVIRAAGALESLGMPERDLVAPRARVLDAPGVSTDDRFMGVRAGSWVPRRRSSSCRAVLDVLERSARPRPSSGADHRPAPHLRERAHAVERLARTKDRALIAPLLEAARNARYSQPRCSVAGAVRAEARRLDRRAVGFLDAPDPKARHAALALLGRQLRDADVQRWSPAWRRCCTNPTSWCAARRWGCSVARGGLAAARSTRSSRSSAIPIGDAPARRRSARRDGRPHAGRDRRCEDARRRRRAQPARVARVERSDADVRSAAKKSLARLGGDAGAGNASANRGARR